MFLCNSFAIRVITICFLLFCVAVSSSWARLGETKEQIEGRYGHSSVIPPYEQRMFHDSADWHHLRYSKDKYNIDVTFHGEVSVSESYSSPNDDFAPEQIQQLLSINSQGHQWKQTIFSSQPEWDRDDGALAREFIMGATKSFLIQTKEDVDHWSEVRAAEKKKSDNMDGF